MKYILNYTFLLMIGFGGYAQSQEVKLTNDLLKNNEIGLANYIPMANNNFMYKMYVIPPKEMVDRLNKFEASYASVFEKEPNEELRILKKMDLNYHKRNILLKYIGLYGVDSIGMSNLGKVMFEKKSDPNFTKLLAEAQVNAYKKKLTKSEKQYLTDQFLAGGNVNNETLFKRSDAYRNWVDNYITTLRKTKYADEKSPLGPYNDEMIRIAVVNREIVDPFIKEYLNYELTTQFIKKATDEATIDKAFQDFMQLATNLQFKRVVKDLYDNYKAMAPNSLAPTFTYHDVDGKEISLTDLRGKFVYIDVWATWCGPCKAQFPYLKVIEEKFKDKNIHFVSLSIDKMENKDKWISYVKNNDLHGIQIMADKDFSSDFVKKFNINAIPRFILIDPEGRIVDHDAKRPSNPALTTQLESLLN